MVRPGRMRVIDVLSYGQFHAPMSQRVCVLMAGEGLEEVNIVTLWKASSGGVKSGQTCRFKRRCVETNDRSARHEGKRKGRLDKATRALLVQVGRERKAGPSRERFRGRGGRSVPGPGLHANEGLCDFLPGSGTRNFSCQAGFPPPAVERHISVGNRAASSHIFGFVYLMR